MSRSGSSEQDANFLGRWARRKAQSKSDKQAEQIMSAPAQATTPESKPEPARAPLPESPESSVDQAPAPIPPIESLEDDSDYSRFMAKDVSQDLRRLALRRLFKAPVFGIRDGLDDYDEDFTTFETLGTTITADMKFHRERLELEAKQQDEEQDQLSVARANSEQNQQKEMPGLTEDAADETSDIASQTMPPDTEQRDERTAHPGQADMAVWELPAQRPPESSPPVLAPRRQQLRLRTDAPDDAQES